MLSTEKKSAIITKFAASSGDTGSPQVQIALLSEQINQLASHLKGHPKDNHSRRGLLKMVSKRRRLLNYLGKNNPSVYQDLLKKIKIG